MRIFLFKDFEILEWIYSIILEVEFSALQYTPAVDIWGLGCIFAEVLTGKPLFPGKSAVHQLELITDLLGTPSLDTISRVCNDKARKHLTNMRKKKPVSFSEKFLEVDPLALKLLQRLLAFDPKDRPTAEQALADPYFKGLSKLEREPSCQPFSKSEFDFERRRVTKDDIRELIYREILEYHPQLLKDYTTGNDQSSFLYPSAIGQIRREFAYFEENVGKSGPVIPPERKHASLPRSTVSSSTTAPKLQHCLASFNNRDNNNAVSRPPPSIPKGRAPGPVLSPHYAYRSNSWDQARSQRKTTDRRLSPGLVNRHGQHKSSDVIAIDAKFVQAQSHRGVVGLVHMG